MSLTVVGSIAFDSVRTPFGERDRMLGGAAVHFSLAASFFTEVRPVGPVGDDFGDERVRGARGPRRASPTTSSGSPAASPSSGAATTSTTSTSPTPRTPSSASSPSSSRSSPRPRGRPTPSSSPTSSPTCSARCAPSASGARFCGLDSMNLWIETARDSLVAAIAEVDCLVAQRRRDPPADRRVEPGPRRPRGDGAWARARSSPSRASTAPRSSPRDGFFALPGLPARGRPRPDRRRRQLRRRLPRLPRQPRQGELDDACLRRAMGYGTVLASFNVEEFGTERVSRLTREEIDERFETLRAMTQFEALPAPPSSPRVAARASGQARQTAILGGLQIQTARGGVMATEQQIRDAAADGGASHRHRVADRHRQPHRQDLRAADHRRHRARHGPAPDQGRRGRIRDDVLRPGLHQHRLLPLLDHLHRRRRGDPRTPRLLDRAAL